MLEAHHELALPAAERSLHFAREVHGQHSIELVPPLLALADVASTANAREAVSYVSRGAFIIQEEHAKIRARIEAPLGAKLGADLRNFQRAAPLAEAARRAQFPPFVRNQSTKSEFQLLLEHARENALRDEVYRAREGRYLAFLTSKFWTSHTKILVCEENYAEGLRSGARALYFAALSCTADSLQACLAIYQLAHLGQLSDRFAEAHQLAAFRSAQAIFRGAMLRFYSPLLLQIQQRVEDRKLEFSFDSEPLAELVTEYNKAQSMSDEDRLSFRADVKEAIQKAIYSMQFFEKAYGTSSQQYCECVVLIGVGLQCTEDSGVTEWDLNARQCSRKLFDVKDHLVQTMVHLYRILYAW